ncbi:hypothetical protein CAEBREN_08179 [Caenorhabditis brenneri]|uniref:Uncharacterized protein n=1 Tax=Caenorhabditis brenneri TaxID=135651 RepID=G0N958_CAEBE|nr:hypothetical protein CAEBREN_08179 [Caenorhabditis brenneri]
MSHVRPWSVHTTPAPQPFFFFFRLLAFLGKKVGKDCGDPWSAHKAFSFFLWHRCADHLAFHRSQIF